MINTSIHKLKPKLKKPPTTPWHFNVESTFTNLGELTTELGEKYGDIVRISRLNRWYFINHPDYIRHVLLENQANYTKINAGFKRISAIFGRGLLTVTDTIDWQRQHDLLQKSFHLKQLPHIAQVTKAHLEKLSQQLDHYAASDKVFNLTAELMGLIVRASSEALFGYGFDALSSYQIIADLECCNRYVSFGLAPNFYIPTAGNLQFHLARRRLRRVVKAIIQQGLNRTGPADDLLSLLLGSLKTDPKQSMQEIEDQVFTFLVTGHETTGSLLSWVFLCLEKNPTVFENLIDSLSESLGNMMPSFEQLNQLEYLRMVIDETLRLYPSIWHIVRRGTQADRLGEYAIPAGASMIISQYALHRHPVFWPDPTVFRPERFDKTNKLTRLSYLPFGFGPRTCIAASMAMMQAKLVVATLLQRYRFKIFDPDRIRKEFLISMRPKDGLRATVTKISCSAVRSV